MRESVRLIILALFIVVSALLSAAGIDKCQDLIDRLQQAYLMIP